MMIKALTFIGISAAIYAVIALGLILSQRPEGPTGEAGLNFDRLGVGADPLVVTEVAMRDGYPAQVRHLPGPGGAPLVILLHGSGWFGAQFDRLAVELSEVAEVVVPDLRGHGAKPGRRGDIDHMAQFEEDIADLIARFAKPGQQVVLAGHSSGGGLVIRFAGGAQGALIDRAVLLAPFVQYDAPTARENSGGWARPLTRRIVGLSMLNMVGIHALDHLVAMEFNMPRDVLDGPLGERATTAYSWRLNQGYAPRRDWKADIAALPEFLLIAGAADEAFHADLYEPTFAEASTRGRFAILPETGHLDVVNAPETARMMRDFILE